MLYERLIRCRGETISTQVKHVVEDPAYWNRGFWLRSGISIVSFRDTRQRRPMLPTSRILRRYFKRRGRAHMPTFEMIERMLLAGFVGSTRGNLLKIYIYQYVTFCLAVWLCIGKFPRRGHPRILDHRLS